MKEIQKPESAKTGRKKPRQSSIPKVGTQPSLSANT